MDFDKLLDSQKMATKTLQVSDNFVEIYRLFNVYDQVENIERLDERERYLLILLCLDKHNNEDPIAKSNFQPFRKEAMEIYDLQDDKPTSNSYLLELMELTGDENISTEVLVTKNGEKLPEPLTREEVRDVKIDKITGE